MTLEQIVRVMVDAEFAPADGVTRQVVERVVQIDTAFSEDVAELEALVSRWHGQGPLSLPGGVSARRRDGRIEFVRIDP